MHKRTPARRQQRRDGRITYRVCVEKKLPRCYQLAPERHITAEHGVGRKECKRCAETHRHGRTASVRACVQSVDNKRIIFIDFPAALERGRKVRKSAQRCLEAKKEKRKKSVWSRSWGF